MFADSTSLAAFSSRVKTCKLSLDAVSAGENKRQQAIPIKRLQYLARAGFRCDMLQFFQQDARRNQIFHVGGARVVKLHARALLYGERQPDPQTGQPEQPGGIVVEHIRMRAAHLAPAQIG